MTCSLTACGDKTIPSNSDTLVSSQNDEGASIDSSKESSENTTNEMSENSELESNQSVSSNDSITITGFTKNYVYEKEGVFYFPVQYTIGQDSYTGYMDNTGIITSDIPSQYQKSGNTSVLFNDDGSISYTQTCNSVYDGVVYEYDGIFMWHEDQSNIDGKKIVLGLKDCNGSWLYNSPVDVLEITGVDFDTDTEYDYLGEGMFSAYDLSQNHGNHLLIFNANNGEYIHVEDVYPRAWAFYDGTMIYQQWDGGQSGGHKGKICLLCSDGTIQELNGDGDLLTVNEKGFLTEDRYGISYYDRNGNIKWTFDKYEIARRSRPVLYEDFVFANVTGADNKTYTISLNSNGELVFDPFETCSTIVVDGHYALKETNIGFDIVDLTTGNVNATIDIPNESYLIEDLGYEDDYGYDEYEVFGTLFIINSNGEYLFYNTDGQEIIPTISQG